MASLSFAIFSLVEFAVLNRGVDSLIQQQRVSLTLIFLAIGVHAHLYPKFYERWYEWAVSVLILLYAAAILYFEFNTQLAGHPEFFYLSVNSTCILLTIACYYFMRLPVRLATGLSVCLGAMTFYAVHMSGVFEGTVAGRMLTYIGVSNVAGLWIRNIFDWRDREIFAQNQKINSLMLAEAAANQAKTKLLAMMSHEIRTPMHTVSRLLVAVQRDFDGELSDKRMAMFKQVEQACEQLVNTLDDLLHFAAIGGRSEMLAGNATPFSLSELIDECCDLVALSAKEKGIALKVDLDDLPSVSLLGQPHYLKRVLINLLVNAIKFTSRGGVTVCARMDPCGDAMKVSVSVSDTGVGIPAEEHRNIFELFYQVDSAYSRRYTGSGLGLAICRQLMAAMDGDIQVESEMEKGSTFTISFTASCAPDAEMQRPLRTA
jgi:signal transduction histidine kinase